MSTYRASWNGVVLAESDDTVEVEGNQYFPLTDTQSEHFQPSGTHTTCHWKGEASYYHVQAGGKENRDAAWFYPAPKEGAEMVTDRVAFWKGVEVEEVRT